MYGGHSWAPQRGQREVNRSRIFDNYPDLDVSIGAQLRSLRFNGLPVNSAIARSVIMKEVQQQAPELISERNFRCGHTFVHQYLKKVLDWSSRVGTQNATKHNRGWEQACKETILRIILTMKQNDIPPSLVINGDQAGLQFFPSATRTWAPRGSKQVSIHGKGDKRQFTLMVASAMDGTFLPPQAILKGKSVRSLPPARSKAEELGIQFDLNPKNHWSSVDSMKAWVNGIVKPYIDKVKARDQLPDWQQSILFIDCWKVHRSEEFRNWMTEHHSNITIRYVPGTCTGDLQPADVGLQRLIKHKIKQDFGAWLMDQIKDLDLEDSDDTEHFKKLTATPSLRNLIPSLLKDMYQYFSNENNCDMVKMVSKAFMITLTVQAWRKCQIEDLSLDAAFCTSSDAKDRAAAYAAANPKFRETLGVHEPLTDGKGKAPEQSVEEPDPVDSEPEMDDDVFIDLRDLCQQVVELQQHTTESVWAPEPNADDI